MILYYGSKEQIEYSALNTLEFIGSEVVYGNKK